MTPNVTIMQRRGEGAQDCPAITGQRSAIALQCAAITLPTLRLRVQSDISGGTQIQSIHLPVLSVCLSVCLCVSLLCFWSSPPPPQSMWCGSAHGGLSRHWLPHFTWRVSGAPTFSALRGLTLRSHTVFDIESSALRGEGYVCQATGRVGGASCRTAATFAPIPTPKPTGLGALSIPFPGPFTLLGFFNYPRPGTPPPLYKLRQSPKLIRSLRLL